MTSRRYPPPPVVYAPQPASVLLLPPHLANRSSRRIFRRALMDLRRVVVILERMEKQA